MLKNRINAHRNEKRKKKKEKKEKNKSVQKEKKTTVHLARFDLFGVQNIFDGCTQQAFFFLFVATPSLITNRAPTIHIFDSDDSIFERNGISVDQQQGRKKPRMTPLLLLLLLLSLLLVPLSASLTLTSRKIHGEKDFSNVYARASYRAGRTHEWTRGSIYERATCCFYRRLEPLFCRLCRIWTLPQMRHGPTLLSHRM